MKTKKIVKKKKEPTQKQTQSQKTKVVVNIGKTIKTRKARTQKKVIQPEPARPQIIPVYTPVYQTQQQQQTPPYTLDDIKTLFKARENTRENLQKEILKDAVEQTQGPNPRQIREEARQRQQAEAQGRREGEIIARGEELIAERQRPAVEAEALRQANIRRQQEEAEQQRQREVQQRRDEVQQRRDEVQQRREQRAEEVFTEPENKGEELRLAFFKQNTEPDLQQVLIEESLQPVVNRPPETIITDPEVLSQLQSEDEQLYQRLYGVNEALAKLESERLKELEQERQQIDQTFYKPPPTTITDLLQAPTTANDEFFDIEEPEEEPPAEGGGGGGGGGGPAEEPPEEVEQPPEEEPPIPITPKKLIGGGPAEEPQIIPTKKTPRQEQKEASEGLKKQYEIKNIDEIKAMVEFYNQFQPEENRITKTNSGDPTKGNRNSKTVEQFIIELLERKVDIRELKRETLAQQTGKKQ